MLGTILSNSHKIVQMSRPRLSREAGVPSARCTWVQLLAMGGVIFSVALIILSLLVPFAGALTWPIRLLSAAGMVTLLLPALYLMWGRPLAAYLKELQLREEDIRGLSRRLLTAGEQERHRLALDLHDEFGQSLSTLRWGMESLKRELAAPSDQELERCEQLLAQVDALGGRIRHLSASLHPVMLDDLGLVPTLQWAAQELRQRHPGLEVTFAARGLKRRLSSAIDLTLYRVAQEAMSNALRHARAGSLKITLTACYPQVVLQVQDDGVGFVPPSASGSGWSGGLGLFGMRERVASVGGRLTLSSAPGAGTLVRVEVPVSQEVSE